MKTNSTQFSPVHTFCAVCGRLKQTPLRRDEMGGYVCLRCVEKELDRLREALKRVEAILQPFETGETDDPVTRVLDVILCAHRGREGADR